MSSAQLGVVLRHIRRLAATRQDLKVADRQLLEQFATHQDGDAFAALLGRHGGMVLGVCQSVLHNLHDAEDAFQATFLVLARKAGSIHRREAVSSWLHRVAYHLAVDAVANAARRRVLERRAVAMPSDDPVLDMSLRELRAVLHEELRQLPAEYRAPLVLCGLEEKTVEEAARQLGWTKWTVKGRLQRGRERLRARLRQRGLELSAGLFAAALSTGSTSAHVTAALAASTIQAVQWLAADKEPVAGVLSAKAAALIQGATTTMFYSKAKIATALLLALAVAGATVGALRHGADAADPPAAEPGQAAKPQTKGNRSPEARPRPAAGPTVEVRGRVLDPRGRPVAGAKLYLAKASDVTADDLPAAPQATSRADGRFRFTVARSALDQPEADGPQAQVMAVAPGFGCAWAQVGPAGREITLRLVNDVPIRGRILDPDGQPVVGAKLTVFGLSAAKNEDLSRYVQGVRTGVPEGLPKFWRGPLPGRPAVLTTARDGRFRLAGVGRERLVYLWVEGPTIAKASMHVMTRAAAPVTDPKGRMRIYGASFDFVGGPTRLIRGVVRDKATGKPISGVSVEAERSAWFKSVTDRDGRYELRGLAKAQRYSLAARPGDGLHFQRELGVQDTPGLDALACDIALVRGLTVRGRVTDRGTGKPIAGARVDYHPLGGNTYVNKLLAGSWVPRSETTTGADGSYTLTVMPGPGVIGVTAPRWTAYLPAAVPVKERKAFFKARLVEVKEGDEEFLTSAAGGGAIGGISVIFYNAMVLLEPGEKDLAVVRDVALERPRERRGHVVGPDNRPLAGVTVYGLARFGIDTLKSDEFVVQGVNPRAKRPLVLHHEGKKLGFYLKDLREQPPGPITVKLQLCGSASGRVVDQDGQPVVGLHLQLEGHGLRVVGGAGGGHQRVRTDEQGRFRIEGLVPGQDYMVSDRSETPGFPRVFAGVVVESGKHKDLGDLKLRERRQ
jgi:RNA polymerase sigma factor (sigma-70 family)